MQRIFTFFAGLCFLLTTGILNAQTSVNTNSTAASLTLTPAEETFFEDVSNQVIYIDFETVNVNLSDIKVKNAAGEIVLKDELWSLPVNTIYELDYSTYEPGDYEIEIRSFTGIMRKTVSVK